MLDKTVRCDKCGAEAWVSVKKITDIPTDTGTSVPSVSQLDFCGHDYNANSIMLHAEGWAISNDERDSLLVNPKPVQVPVANA